LFSDEVLAVLEEQGIFEGYLVENELGKCYRYQHYIVFFHEDTPSNIQNNFLFKLGEYENNIEFRNKDLTIYWSDNYFEEGEKVDFFEERS
jgi:hypothetical protein